ncbi:hypothetical protein [[Mycobacterium] crassicus]|uniref:Nucleotidyl transferase n=1 Tax=[Mycobacterium] crassicus TaxID=2872309 RepID=A0ABU5XN23_9MYCO|nr:hypothetical protein [Mycolicibacter sp. MYC098]MEB3023388.1 hypothetical protein [Mycolicibacter sp. MYC098]
MTASEIRQLLVDLDAELQQRGKAATLFVVGGAAMALAYNASRATDDVDGTFEPRDAVLEAAAAVAEQWPGLDSSWLSDGVIQLMPPLPDDHPRGEIIGPALTVSIASAEYVLAMKAMVSRKSQGDVDDAVALCLQVGVTNEPQLEDVVARYFPGRQFGSQELFFERIIESLPRND